MEQVSEKFKEKLLIFLEELSNKFPADSTLFSLAKMAIFSKQAQHIIENFIDQIMPLKQYIKDRDAGKIFEHAKNVPEQSLTINLTTIFCKLEAIWNSLDADEQHVIWQWFDLFIKFCDRYLQGGN